MYHSPEAGDLYRHLRAAAESGWDFGSRWLVEGADGKYSLTGIRTTHILPVDLNSLMVAMEDRLSRLARQCGQPERAESYRRAAAVRRDALHQVLVDDETQWFIDRVSPQLGLSGDVTLQQLERTGVISLAEECIRPSLCEVLDATDPKG